MKKIADILLQEKDQKAIQEAVALLRHSFPVTEIKLFGSKARGDDDTESDIDLLVLTSRAISWRERYRMTETIYGIQLKYSVVISLLVVPQEKWDKGILSAHPIHYEIEEQGVAA